MGAIVIGAAVGGGVAIVTTESTRLREMVGTAGMVGVAVEGRLSLCMLSDLGTNPGWLAHDGCRDESDSGSEA